MKKFTILSNYLFLLMAAAILGLTACGDDPILTNELPPSVTINSAETEIDPGQTITLSISGSQGDGAMNLLTITEDGTTIDLSRITSSDIGGNPASLLGDNASAFAFTVEIDGPTIPGVYTYAANVGDENGKSNTVFVDVTVVEEVATPPAISYMGTTPRAVSLGGNVFNITSTIGSADLTTIAVYEDEDLINPSRLAFNSVDFDTNPYSLVGDDLTGFDMADVLVRFTEAGTFNLRFEVTDANGETASTEVSVVAGTPITNQYEASLLSNADGPAGPTEPNPVLGGLDLDTGANVSVNSADADIIDLGLNLTTGEWRQQIQGNNGTTLRAANSSSPELFNYENINSREAIIAAFDAGVDANPSEVVTVGNVFMANRGDDYFIMTVTNVDVTPNDNRDSYLFDIKTSIQ